MGIPKPPTAQSLERSALHYLERFAASAAGVRQVLMRRVRKACMAHELDPAEYEAVVDGLVETLKARGYLNDTAFAETRINSLQRQGRGPRRIRETLLAKGVDRETVETTLNSFLEDNPDAEWDAAQRLARKRGLGPFRPTEESRREHRQKDFAALMRAGFSVDTVRRLLETDEAGEDDLSGF